MPHTLQNIHLKSRRLLTAVFATLLVVAVAFVGTFLYFNVLNQRVFQNFQQFATSANINADISREMVDLELKIREMMTVVLTSPDQLPQIKESLLEEFADIRDEVSDPKLSGHLPTNALLDNYKLNLDALLQDYAAMNDTLLWLNTFYDHHLEKLKQLEETLGQLIVDAALSGNSNVALQQNFLLIPLCVEEFLHSHQLIRLAITENKAALLGMDSEGSTTTGKTGTTLGHLQTMEKTLSTMTSAQEPIGEEIAKLLKELPSYRERTAELGRILLSLRDNTGKFQNTRSGILDSLQKIDANTSEGIVGIRSLIDRHRRLEFIVSFVISGSILAVSLLGLLVAWKMSRHLESTTREAVQAKAQQELINEQLQQEIDERHNIERALRQAHDGLELRVAERTAELTQTNAKLLQEVAERQTAEKDLASERERLAVTLRSIGDGVISTDTAGRITLLNRNAELLTGWRQDDALGRPLHEIFRIFHEESRRPCESPVDKVLATGSIVELANHTILITKDGKELNIADSGAPIHDKEQRIIGVVLVFRDVTEQLKQEEELFTSQKMESIGTLAGGIAHDFNNILTAIIGFTELAMLKVKENPPALDNLREVRKASNRATDLVRQILTYSRRQHQEKSPQQLSLIVLEALKLLRASIPATIDIQQEITSEAAVMADPSQIHQVIMNLGTNAYHAMIDREGVLAVSLHEVSSSTAMHDCNTALPPGRYLKLSVSDTGCGMDKAVIDKIFEPYFTTKEQGKGTGLGLAVVQGIVRSHDGRITVQSEPGRGTTFNVYLPMIVHTSEEEIIEESPPLASARQRLMVVDDESMIRNLTGQFLTSAGYRVATFANGLEAWHALSQAPDDWDLLVTDQTMPEMTGDQLATKALAVRPDLPIIICSGYNATLLGEQTRHSEAITYLQKPININALLTRVAKALESRQS